MLIHPCWSFVLEPMLGNVNELIVTSAPANFLIQSHSHRIDVTDKLYPCSFIIDAVTLHALSVTFDPGRCRSIFLRERIPPTNHTMKETTLHR